MATKGKKILIIEDEPNMLRLLSEHLAENGFSSLLARDGAAGLKKALKEKPDLILLDIIMPRMDGLTMLHKLRKDKWGAKVPVVILTNLSDGESVAAAMQAGVYDFLVKSDWHLDDVIQKIKDRLK